jgi:protease I
MERLNNIRVAILTEDGFEEVELTHPLRRLKEAGATVEILAPAKNKVKAWNGNEKDWGIEIEVDKQLEYADLNDYDVLVLPGGVMNPDKLRQNDNAVLFTKKFLKSGKLVAAICHGPQTLIETGLLEGKTMTSFPSLQTDLKNAGANWVDQEMVHDGNLITSRRPADIPAFNDEIIKTLSGK